MISIRLILILLAFITALILSACDTSTNSTEEPDCEIFPGMPDRPCDPADTIQPNFRSDSGEAVGTTGHPQLLVFYDLSLDPRSNQKKCDACQRLMPTVQQLEADYWDRIDFVYLNRDASTTTPLLDEYHLNGSIDDYRLNMILVDAAGEFAYRFYLGADVSWFNPETQDIDLYRRILDNQLAKLEEPL
jgi:hypothetical protein